MLALNDKNWDHYVFHAEVVARSPGFRHLRDAILEHAAIGPDESVLDLGAGTGLLTIEAAARARRVWAVDISPRMCDYLITKSRSAGLKNIEPVVSSVTSLPLMDETIDVAISNYCLHHLPDDEKLLALREAHRVLVPGGRLVLADMMFSVGLSTKRDRTVVKDKVRALLRKGAPGAWRLARNAGRFAARRWEHPACPEWWEGALRATGFIDVAVESLEHEGGIARALKP